MWLSGQQKQPADPGEGQTGIVTMSGGELAVMLDCERRGLQLYGPAGYRWTPKVGQRVLVIQGKGETPCVVGLRQDGSVPDQVDISAKRLTAGGTAVNIQGGTRVTLEAPRIDLNGEIYIRGEKLEDMIARIVIAILAGLG